MAQALMKRLKNWWEGEVDAAAKQGRTTATKPAKSPSPSRAGDVQAAETDDEEVEVDEAAVSLTTRSGKPLWTADRLEVAQTMWGRGHLMPGCETLISQAIRAMSVNSQMSIAEIGAGLGGTALSIAELFRVYVTAYEYSPLLRKEARAHCRTSEYGRYVNFGICDSHAPKLKRRYDRVIMANELLACKDIPALLRSLRQQMKPTAQLMMLDYMMDDDAAPGALDGWAAKEIQEPALLTRWDWAEALGANGWNVRSLTDVSDQHMTDVVAGLKALHARLETMDAAEETRKHINAEMTLWVGRAAALKQGLRLFRVHAIASTNLDRDDPASVPLL